MRALPRWVMSRVGADLEDYLRDSNGEPWLVKGLIYDWYGEYLQPQPDDGEPLLVVYDYEDRPLHVYKKDVIDWSCLFDLAYDLYQSETDEWTADWQEENEFALDPFHTDESCGYRDFSC